MTTELLVLLQQLQLQSKEKGYLNGIFSSTRFHRYLPYIREDENIYFSAFIAFNLQNNFSFFKTAEEKDIAKNIIHKIIIQYPNFKNNKRDTYNFFKTKPLDYFPNGRFMKYFNFFKLADDADDTVYIYLTQPNQNHEALKTILSQYANRAKKQIKHTFNRYKTLQCYNVYFGEKMPVEIDVCVLSTILFWTEKHQLSINIHDLNSYNYLTQSIITGDYKRHPQIISPCYPTFEQICYHVSRLYSLSKNEEFLNSKQVVIQDIIRELQYPCHNLKRLLLEISLLKLGIKRPAFNFDINSLIQESSFFYTSIPMMIPNLFIRKLSHKTIHNWLGLRTKCDAYIICLLLEYELFQTKR